MSHRLRRKAVEAAPVLWPDAVRPAPGVEFTAIEGYRPDRYLSPQTGLSVRALAVAAGRDRVFELFLAMAECLGPAVDVILESSHYGECRREVRRTGMDRPVVASFLCEFDELLVEDGCTAVALSASGGPAEVQFDEHKSLVVYARNRRPFRDAARAFGLRRRDQLVLISEVRHTHRTTREFAATFRELADLFESA